MNQLQTLVGAQAAVGDWEIGENDAASALELIGDNSSFDTLLTSLAGAAVPEDVKQQVMAKVLGRNATVLRERRPDKSRVFPIGFTSDGAVASGDTVVIVTRPQVLFRGERLVIPSDLAGSFVLEDFKVGKASQFVADGPIPARVLQEDAVNVVMQLDTNQIAQDLALTVTNTSGAALVFRAAVFGRVAEV